RFDKDWNADRRGRESDFLWSWLEHTSRPTRRGDLSQLVAKVPLAYAAFLPPIVLAFLSVLGPTYAVCGSSSVGSIAATPWLTMLYTYCGVVLCIALSVLAYVYIARVVEPRLRRSLEQETIGVAGLFRAHWELAVASLAYPLLAVASDAIR